MSQDFVLTPDWWRAIVLEHVDADKLLPYRPGPEDVLCFFPDLGNNVVCLQIAQYNIEQLLNLGCPKEKIRLTYCSVLGANGKAEMTYPGGVIVEEDRETVLKTRHSNHAVAVIDAIQDGVPVSVVIDCRKHGIPLGPKDPFYASYVWTMELNMEDGLWHDLTGNN